MFYPKAKEREVRFKLALRMGLPIFSLTFILTFIGLSKYFQKIPTSFVVMSLIILGIMIYFIFYLIYKGFDERITDPITHTFTREYLLQLFKKEIAKGPYTIILVTVDNLHDINQRYSTFNGDKVLTEFSNWVGTFLEEKGIEKFPIGHFKGGDFLIGLHGEKSNYATLLDLLCIKIENRVVDDIEIHISGAIIDSTLTDDVHQLITRLFEQQQEMKESKSELAEEEEEINPSDLELSVINAIKERKFSMRFQKSVEGKKLAILDSSIKLYGNQEKLIHQKSYIPVINRIGLSREFDEMMLEHLVELCNKTDGTFIFALTLFPSSVRNSTFFEKARLLLNNNSATKGRILFILAEQEYYNQITRYNDMLQSYRRMGILIALDRLGIYQTTLLYLKELDIDLVRFDQRYGKQIEDKGYQGLLRGLNVSAHYLGIKTWIRTIEDSESEMLAESIGIDYIQGKQIGMIAPIEEIIK